MKRWFTVIFKETKFKWTFPTERTFNWQSSYFTSCKQLNVATRKTKAQIRFIHHRPVSIEVTVQQTVHFVQGLFYIHRTIVKVRPFFPRQLISLSFALCVFKFIHPMARGGKWSLTQLEPRCLKVLHAWATRSKSYTLCYTLLSRVTFLSQQNNCPHHNFVLKLPHPQVHFAEAKAFLSEFTSRVLLLPSIFSFFLP